uniref:ATP synthase F0 subunit 8 n=1 Tax=Lasius spathepus TaxID=67765 RepID=A0A7S7BHG1_9HYME|nr:ATP synthase F0 subunit 8 [Lasius spathepus]QOW83462.1 ATP synthase F0 subunit 8 [Lasius spathepus]
MPHMMPMMWTLMMLFSLTILLMIISMTHFIYTHTPLSNKFNSMYSHKLNKWIWKW